MPRQQRTSRLKYFEQLFTASWLVLIAALIIVLPTRLHAFEIGSPISTHCHEQITVQGAFCKTAECNQQVILPDSPYEYNVSIQEIDPLLDKLATYFYNTLNISSELDDDFNRFLITNLLIGARYPDQGGFAITDISNMRELHLDRGGQERHALRNPGDLGQVGAIAALHRTTNYILQKVKDARHSFHNSVDSNQQITAASIQSELELKEFYVEFYGQVSVKIWKPVFLLGEAIHAFQDSYTHSYRSDDGTEIYEVLSFVKAISGHFESGPGEHGAAHSNALDDCSNPDLEELFGFAIAGSRDIFLAVKDYFSVCAQDNSSREAEASLNFLRNRLNEHLRFNPNCGLNVKGPNGDPYCGSKWAKFALLEETKPLFSCASSAHPSPSLLALLLLTCLCLLSRRPIQRSSSPRPQKR